MLIRTTLAVWLTTFGVALAGESRESAVSECTPDIWQCDDSGPRYLMLPAGEHMLYRIPVRLTREPRSSRVQHTPAGEARLLRYCVFRVRSTTLERPFVFSFCAPDTAFRTEEHRFPLSDAGAHRIVRHPSRSIGVHSLRLTTNSAGRTHLVWTDGRDHLFIREITAPNDEDQVVRRFLDSFSRMDEAFVRYAKGVEEAIRAGKKEPEPPAALAEHVGKGVAYGLAEVDAVIDMRDLLVTERLLRDCQAPPGYVFVRVWQVSPYAPSVHWMRWAKLRILFQGRESLYQAVGSGTKWRLVSSARLDDGRPQPEEFGGFEDFDGQ